MEASYRISENFAIGGWVGYTAARAIGLGDGSIWNYAIAFGFPDLGKEGNLGGIIIGMQPKLTGMSSSLRAVGNRATPILQFTLKASTDTKLQIISLSPWFDLADSSKS
ncbi:carbohydrate porin [Chroococcidiopsis sp [FACHB-1243]]|uniref:carbohydrate porin n=1 Tax=Chroococcidiopsis sp. [FACHB-1243] TaxID=2692781 RepID=UPI0032201C51